MMERLIIVQFVISNVKTVLQLLINAQNVKNYHTKRMEIVIYVKNLVYNVIH